MRLFRRLFKQPPNATDIAWQDEQLRLLFNKMTELMEASTTNRDNADVVSLIKFIDDSVKNHFAREEEVLALAPYRVAEAHKKEHEMFAADLDGIKADLASNRWATALRLRKKLAARLFDHICKEDGTLETFFAHKDESHATA